MITGDGTSHVPCTRSGHGLLLAGLGGGDFPYVLLSTGVSMDWLELLNAGYPTLAWCGLLGGVIWHGG